jgi:hypothetical protein
MHRNVRWPDGVWFVFEHDGHYYLFIGPDWQGLLDSMERTGRYDPRPTRTRVLRSADRSTSVSTIRSAPSMLMPRR